MHTQTNVRLKKNCKQVASIPERNYPTSSAAPQSAWRRLATPPATRQASPILTLTLQIATLPRPRIRNAHGEAKGGQGQFHSYLLHLLAELSWTSRLTPPPAGKSFTRSLGARVLQRTAWSYPTVKITANSCEKFAKLSIEIVRVLRAVEHGGAGMGRISKRCVSHGLA